MPTEDLSYLNGAPDHHLPHHPHPHHHPPVPHRRYFGAGPVSGGAGGDVPPQHPSNKTSSSSSSGHSASNLHDPHHHGYAHHHHHHRSPSSASAIPAGARTTATSRRGGRTRSRSPPVMGVPSRMSIDGSPSSAQQQQPLPLPPAPPPPSAGAGGMPENPSSAAAAAAAAAKAFRKDAAAAEHSGAAPSSSSYAARDYKPHQPYPSGGGGAGGPPGGNTSSSSSTNWPGGDDGRGSSAYRYPSSGGGRGGEGPPPYGQPYRSGGGGGGGGGGYYSRGDERVYSSYGEQQQNHHHHRRDRGGSSMHPSQYDGGGYRGGTAAPTSSGSAQPSSRSYQQQEYHSRYGRDAASAAASSKSHSRSSGGGVGGGRSLVIGGTTPIHVPKPSDGPPNLGSSMSSRSLHRGGSASSVFRGRPGGDPAGTASSSRTQGGAASAGLDDSNSPQKILLSLRTPTSSFEDKGSEQTKKAGNRPSSPGDPALADGAGQQRAPDQLFDPQRSPDAQKLVASIEGAPSFSLFNQSFDSFGDGHYFNVDASLQNDSFGMVRAPSVDNDGPNILQSTSVGNFSQQLLASGSGALTLGYSPVNSFGNVSASGGSRRGGTMMVVGGNEGRASSPTQVLGMYRSYSASGNGGAGAARPSSALEDSHLRMSVGSFGSPSMAYSRSYGGEPAGASPYYYPPGGPLRSQDNMDKFNPTFHNFLRRHRNAFKDCTFLLPGLKAALLETPRSEAGDGPHTSSPSVEDTMKKSTSIASSVFGDPSPHDTSVARRRVECSIFAFGGNPNRDRHLGATRAEKSADRNSIFRGKEDGDRPKSASVTPSPAGRRFQSRAKTKYEEGLPARYYENESRLSWEFEESPPIEVSQDEDNDIDSGGQGMSKTGEDDSKDVDGKRADGDDGGSRAGGDNESASKRTSGSPQPKMRYRCKLCGQPKQNHTCPYQQSLARSIGIMVFPAVNAFTASEPGTIAPALSDMNNFTDTQKEDGSNESSPSRPTPDRPPHSRINTSGTVASTTQVTPESMRSSPRLLHSPVSFAGNPGPTPNRRSGLSRPYGVHSSGRKRSFAQAIDGDGQSDLLFLDSMELKPEQFRLVSQPSSTKSADAFNYPSLPLPYAQRKRLSDNLFSLSNEVPKLTDECAQVLREAREKDMWDLAVAELMTQVIVIIHCPEGDNRFEGLRQYLLTLGIAC